jgi:hypothetical protein
MVQDAVLVGELVHANERLQTLQVDEHMLEIAKIRALRGRQHVSHRLARTEPKWCLCRRSPLLRGARKCS